MRPLRARGSPLLGARPLGVHLPGLRPRAPPPVSPVQTWTSVQRGWPSVPTAASTPEGPSRACATRGTSWGPTAGSATVSGPGLRVWARRGVAVTGGGRSAPRRPSYPLAVALLRGGGEEDMGFQGPACPGPQAARVPAEGQAARGQWGRHLGGVPRPGGGSRLRDRDGDREQLRGGQRRLLPRLQPQQRGPAVHLPPRLRAGRGPEDVHRCVRPPPPPPPRGAPLPVP